MFKRETIKHCAAINLRHEKREKKVAVEIIFLISLLFPCLIESKILQKNEIWLFLKLFFSIFLLHKWRTETFFCFSTFFFFPFWIYVFLSLLEINNKKKERNERKSFPSPSALKRWKLKNLRRKQIKKLFSLSTRRVKIELLSYRLLWCLRFSFLLPFFMWLHDDSNLFCVHGVIPHNIVLESAFIVFSSLSSQHFLSGKLYFNANF